MDEKERKPKKSMDKLGDAIEVFGLSQYIFNLMHFTEDCDKLCEIMHKRTGIKITPLQAAVLWGHFSDSLCAGWLNINIPESEVAKGLKDSLKSLYQFIKDYKNWEQETGRRADDKFEPTE